MNPAPEVDRKAQIDYPSPMFSEKLLLGLANANNTEIAFSQLTQAESD
jgi:hypothetical protein